MLNALTIRNLAVVDGVDLELAGGMTALTGETGAGKSILVDALGLVLGDRTDNNMIRAGCERAEITAGFTVEDLPEAIAWLEEHEIDHDNECLLRRILVRDGRSRAFVNGTPVSIAHLAALGEHLLDIHGQHAHQSLTRRAYQRELLVTYGGHLALVEQVGSTFHQLREIRARLMALRDASDERAARLDLLRFQLSELEALRPNPGEWSELEIEHRRLSNAEALRARCENVIGLLFDDEEGAEGRLSKASGTLDDLVEMDPALRETSAMVQSALINLQEAEPALRHYADGVEMDPERLSEIDERITRIHELARKFRVEPDRLNDKLDEMRLELSALDDTDAEIESLVAREQAILKDYRRLAADLGKRRRAAGSRLGREITAAMQELNMRGGSFSVQLEPVAEDEAGAHGMERPEFHVTANPGQPEQPLADVASGGELSRISLAIQVAAAECSRIPTLIFDEVDVGIGGGVAEIVGRLLRRIAASRQVLCVTHLPQVASQAHHHLSVEKKSAKSSTSTLIHTLDEDSRIQEIARMLGGVNITKRTLEHAREMLAMAGVDA